jgi:MFS family permease
MWRPSVVWRPSALWQSPRFQSVLGKPFLPPLFFFAGVIYNSLMLTRIDRLRDNLILLLYLSLLGFLIVLTGRLGTGEVRPEDLDQAESRLDRLLLQSRPYAPMAIQFLLGSLFSAYAVFYWKSASLTGTAVFFCLLVGLLVGNEFIRDRLSNLQLLLALYALVTCSFFTFFLPVMTGWMNMGIFVMGVVLSGLVTWRLVELLYRGKPAWSRREATLAAAPAFGVLCLVVALYLVNWIPPVPLSMKFGGVFHEVRKAGEKFELAYQKRWFQFWKYSDNPFPADEPVYCFTAVFAPVRLETTIFHHWYHRPDKSASFSPADRIPIRIQGGREGGYRAYTFKQGLAVGEWRVDVETEDGRVLGRVRFSVEAELPAQPMTTILY